MADKNNDNSLNPMEVVAFLFPDSDPEVAKFDYHHTFKTYDANGDGRLTLEEYLAGDHHDPEDIETTHLEEKEFDILDRNKDSVLDLEEFHVHESGMFKAEHDFKLIMSHADADGDGKIDVMELDDAYEYIKKAEAHE